MDWIYAKNIAAGDKLLSLDGKDIEVDSVEVLNETQELYKISVGDYNNYFVTSKKLLVHNYFYNAVIEAASTAAARMPTNLCPEICNRIISAVSKAMPIIERIVVAAFSAFLIKHEITKEEDHSLPREKCSHAKEFYEENPFAYCAPKDVIDNCNNVLGFYLEPLYSLAPFVSEQEDAMMCSFSKNEIELQLKNKVFPKLLAAKKEFLKKQEDESKKKNRNSGGDGEGDGENPDDDPNKEKRQIKHVDKEKILGDDTEIEHMLQPKHGFQKIGIDTEKKAQYALGLIIDQVVELGKMGLLQIKENGCFDVVVKIFGHDVVFRGIILEGAILKYGTVFLPKFYIP